MPFLPRNRPFFRPLPPLQFSVSFHALPATQKIHRRKNVLLKCPLICLRLYLLNPHVALQGAGRFFHSGSTLANQLSNDHPASIDTFRPLCLVRDVEHADQINREGCSLGGFKTALLWNPRERIRGRLFSEMVSAQKSELQAQVGVTAKGQSYSRGHPQNPNRIAQKRAEWGLGASTEKHLQAFLNPPKL